MIIAQITDTHIVDKNKHWLSEPATRTSERLERVVAYLNQLNPRPDVVLLTGDASDSGTETAYSHLKELLKPLKTSIFVIPGNHDHREEMRKAFSKESYMPREGYINYVLDEYPVRLIGLDTLVQGESYGYLSDEYLSWMKQIMKEGDEKPTLIFMHHPPAKTGNKLFDKIGCSVPPDFEQLICTQHPILGIICGHYHHLCVTSFGNKSCFIAPSVAPVHYFADPQDGYVTALELEDPAVTLHQWDGNGPMRSHVIRVKEHNSRIDWSLIKET